MLRHLEKRISSSAVLELFLSEEAASGHIEGGIIFFSREKVVHRHVPITFSAAINAIGAGKRSRLVTLNFFL
jgi:hypothetical protein